MNGITGLNFDIDQRVLDQAKTALKLQLLNKLESQSTCVADELGSDVLSYGRRIHPAEQIARIDAVDAQAIKNAARRFFYDRDLATAAVGAIHEIPDYNWFRMRTMRLRY